MAKKVGGGLPFVLLTGVVSAVIYLPIVVPVFVIAPPSLSVADAAIIAGGACIHMTYFIVLMRGYRSGDMSVVYPLARGTGPALTMVAAYLLFEEIPSPGAIIGMVLIGLGVVALSAPLWRRGVHVSGAAVFYALLTGVLIALYTTFDKRIMVGVAILPILYDWLAGAVRTVALAPLLWKHRKEMLAVWHQHRRRVLFICTVSPAGYILMLSAMKLAPVSSIAPLRETSILFGAFLGVMVLGEADAQRRLTAAALMAVGALSIALW